MATYGFIGTGNMGGALARAVVRAAKSDCVWLSDGDAQKAADLAAQLGCKAGTVEEVARTAHYLFLGVKPQVMPLLLADLAPVLRERTDRFVLVSMAAGLSVDKIADMAGAVYPIIRIMPNTPVSTGKGVILYTANKAVSEEEIATFCEAMREAGRLDALPESLIDAASAVSGCGPAFVYMFAEAMADAGVKCGLPREKALLYAAQTLSGAAELLLTAGKHPGTLKDEVCSPGGSTIAGVHSLEENGFRGAVLTAINASFERTKELGK